MKRVAFLVSMLILSLTISAQDLYYMYGKQRIPLQAKENSLVLMVHNTDGIFDLINELGKYGEIHYELSKTDGFVSIEIPHEEVFNNVISIASNSSLVKTYSPAFICEDFTLPSYCIGEVITKLASGKTRAQLDSVVESLGYSIKNDDKFVKEQFIVSVNKKDGNKTIEAANLLFETGLFEFAEPNFLVNDAFNTSDPLFQYQWGLKNTGQNGGIEGVDINAEPAWDITTGSANIVVAVVDNGVQIRSS